MKTFFIILATVVAATSANGEGSCEIPQEDMEGMMEVGQICWDECYGQDYMTMRQDDGMMGLVEFAETYTCPMQCVLREMDLVYEDGWPSIPKLTEFFAFTPLDQDDIGKCFCEGLKSKPMKVLKQVAQYMGSAGEEIAMRSAVPQVRMDIGMLNEVINLEDLPKMYRNLDDQEKDHVGNLIKLAVFSHCVHDSYMEVCPYDYGNYGGTGSGDYGDYGNYGSGDYGNYGSGDYGSGDYGSGDYGSGDYGNYGSGDYGNYGSGDYGNYGSGDYGSGDYGNYGSGDYGNYGGSGDYSNYA